MYMLPAWSAQFSSDSIEEIHRTPPIDTMTPDEAWGGSTGKGVKVAVIDSGIDTTHPAISSLPVSGYVTVSEDDEQNYLYDPEPHTDAYGHGTACAGIIRSLAPECELYSVKVLGAALVGRGSVFLAGLRWAVDNGMHVCNLSLGTTKKDFFAALHELADLAYFHNIVLVAAANNYPKASFPSLYASVVSVASHQKDEYDPYRFYYNPHPPVEFGAPGIKVQVPWLNHEVITATGNSFAAPHITGLVARILAKHPTLTPFQVKTVLRSLAANALYDAQEKGMVNEYV